MGRKTFKGMCCLMSAEEAPTGCSVVNTFGRTPSVSQELQLERSKIETGSRNFEVCRKIASNYRGNETEISVQSCEGNISEEVEKESSTEHQRHPMNPEEAQSQFVQKLTALKGIFSASVNCFRCTLKPDEGGNHDEDQYHPVTIFNKHTRNSMDLNTVCGTSATGINRCIYEGLVEHRSATLNLTNLHIMVQTNPQSSRLESPLVQERIGETSECTAEVIVLANEHAAENITPTHTHTRKKEQKMPPS